MKKIDMSDTAVSRRLRQVEQLRRLSLELMKSKPRPLRSAVAKRSNKPEHDVMNLSSGKDSSAT
jgi:hypothetical protein